MSASSEYQGPERRRHQLFVTKNTEYHFRDGTCVAVRDRHSGNWLPSHLAIRRQVKGGVRFSEKGAIIARAQPELGEALYFGDPGRALVTSALCSVERPTAETVASYSSA